MTPTKNDPDMVVMSRKSLHEELGLIYDKIKFWQTTTGALLVYAVIMTAVYYASLP